MKWLNLFFAILCGFWAVVNTVGYLQTRDSLSLIAAMLNYPASFLNWMEWTSQKEEEIYYE